MLLKFLFQTKILEFIFGVFLLEYKFYITE